MHTWARMYACMHACFGACKPAPFLQAAATSPCRSLHACISRRNECMRLTTLPWQPPCAAQPVMPDPPLRPPPTPPNVPPYTHTAAPPAPSSAHTPAH
eukprot:366330-Chlamydomonas_euryale.AAC.8